jgi:hypothetical protein
MKYLNTTVHVRDEEEINHVFLPGDTVPDWAQKKITNPNVWSSGPGLDPSAAAGEEPGPAEDGDFGVGPFRKRTAPQVKALAKHHGLPHGTVAEAIAALEAEGIAPVAPTEQVDAE